MGTSCFSDNQCILNGSAAYLRAGEIHYFRLPFDQWHDRLIKAREGHLNAVSTYIPWFWHEPVEGAVDLDGRTRPECNLRRFLDLAAELKLHVIARPGPFINSELRYGGFPLWLFRDHPETLSRRSDGHYGTGRPLPAEGEPLYRRYVRQWYHTVVPLIAEYDIHHGGPVILFQPDNELSAAWSYGLFNSLYDPAILAEAWPRWLQVTYKELSAIKRRYARDYPRFEAVEPPRVFPQTQPEKNLCLDWLNFKRWFFADWGATLAQWAIEDGIRVPIIFNEPVAGFYQHGDHAGFGRVLRDHGIAGATACHMYSDRLMDLESLPGAVFAVELVKSSPWGGPPIAMEVNTAWYIPRLIRSPLNWETLLRLGLGRGLMGTVIYPFAAGTVSLDDVIDGPEYWEPTCLTLRGTPTESFYQYRRFNRFIASWEDIVTGSSLATDVTLAYTPGQRLLDFLGVPPALGTAVPVQATPGGEHFNAEPALDCAVAAPSHDWLDGYEGVSRQTVPAEAGLWKKTQEVSLLCARLNITHDMLDLTNPNREPGRGWIIVPCTGSLEKEAIDHLLAHLDRGGGCLFFPTIPVRHPDGTPEGRMQERLKVKLDRLVRPAGGDLLDYGTRVVKDRQGEAVGVNGWIFCHQMPTGSCGLAHYDRSMVIARLPPANGRVIIAGLDLSLTNHASVRLWREVFVKAMGIDPWIRDEGAYYHALLRRGEKASVLTVLNVAGAEGAGIMHVRQPADKIDRLSITVSLALHEARCLLIGAKVGRHRILYTTSELLRGLDEAPCLELCGSPDTPGQIVFAGPVQGRLNGAPVTAAPADGGYAIKYRHCRNPLSLEID